MNFCELALREKREMSWRKHCFISYNQSYDGRTAGWDEIEQIKKFLE
jgi:hypothetical protein